MKKRVLVILAILIGAALIGIAVWWVSPKVFLDDVVAERVDRIEVFDGSTGQSFTVTHEEEIAYIVSNIQSIKTKKDELSSGYDGCRFYLNFYDRAGKKLDSFILNSADTIRSDPFFYRAEHGVFCVDFLQALEEEMPLYHE